MVVLFGFFGSSPAIANDNVRVGNDLIVLFTEMTVNNAMSARETASTGIKGTDVLITVVPLRIQSDSCGDYQLTIFSGGTNNMSAGHACLRGNEWQVVREPTLREQHAREYYATIRQQQILAANVYNNRCREVSRLNQYSSFDPKRIIYAVGRRGGGRIVAVELIGAIIPSWSRNSYSTCY